MPSAGAAVFCGDTKGSIQCFLEGPRSEGRIDGGRDEEVPGAGRVSEGLREALSPCLVLKRQHGKDQVGSLASCRQDKTRQDSSQELSECFLWRAVQWLRAIIPTS